MLNHPPPKKPNKVRRGKEPQKLWSQKMGSRKEDIYEIDKTENYQADLLETKKEPESLGGQGTPINGAPNNEVLYPQKMEPSNTELSNTDLKDLNTVDTEDTQDDFRNNKKNNSFSAKEKARLQGSTEVLNSSRSSGNIKDWAKCSIRTMPAIRA